MALAGEADVAVGDDLARHDGPGVGVDAVRGRGVGGVGRADEGCRHASASPRRKASNGIDVLHRPPRHAGPGRGRQAELAGHGAHEDGVVADDLVERVLDELAPPAPGRDERPRLLQHPGGVLVAGDRVAVDPEDVGVDRARDDAGRAHLAHHPAPDRPGRRRHVERHPWAAGARSGLGAVEPRRARLAAQELELGRRRRRATATHQAGTAVRPVKFCQRSMATWQYGKFCQRSMTTWQYLGSISIP